MKLPKLDWAEWVYENCSDTPDAGLTKAYLLDVQIEKHGSRKAYARYLVSQNTPHTEIEQEFLLDFIEHPNKKWTPINRDKDHKRFRNMAIGIDFLYLTKHDGLSGRKAAKQLSDVYHLDWNYICRIATK